METTSTRYQSVDFLRGIAIFAMLCANVIGYVSPASQHPEWIRFYGSIAAPLFITLAGYMVAYTSDLKKYNLNYYLIRGFLILLTGILIDAIIWKIYPLTTFDVLYLIGLSLPLVFLFHNLKITYKLVVISIVILTSVLLRKYFGYSDYPIEIDIFTGEKMASPENQTSIINHLFIDGWFPIFPWLAFSFFGSVIYTLASKYKNFTSTNSLITSIGLITIGLIWLYVLPLSSLLVSRENYSEIFYPPTIPFIIYTFGLILLLWGLANRITNFKILRPITLLGETSLFIYILHSCIVKFAVTPIFKEDLNKGNGSFNTSLGVYLLVYLTCLGAAYLIHNCRKKYGFKNFFVRFFLGS